ncbi:LANO_0E12398g1_1 [Lachancea nothofagi CBS 11611]|uniref:LANO_0E12398g1_1 n=1 Tax=Lachancea nothofagi CBS 11611 TaxID=1266666 RepID=A0A1G4JYB6_9SACH|nr:LANO_0E12398g1_1 [Lachancea nothofagi CBS 11611]
MSPEPHKASEEPRTRSRVQPGTQRKPPGRKASKRAVKRLHSTCDDENELDDSGFVTHSSQNEDQVHSSRDENIERVIHEDGSTSNYFDKRKLKIAPRSTLQFKVGPTFTKGNSYCKVICTEGSKPVNFALTPRIDRGFDLIENDWIGYKRNYFTLVTSFEINGIRDENFLHNSYQVAGRWGTDRVLDAKYFAVRLVAICTEDQSSVSLVQHTAKRDKGPQFEPPVLPLVPAPLPTHQIIREASNVRNETKMKKYDHLFYFNRSSDSQDQSTSSVVSTYPHNRIKKVARYERVQFSSSINAKKQTNQIKHFQLRVVLGCVVDGKHINSGFCSTYGGLDCLVDNDTSTFVPITDMVTPPLVIRGRSPSNYCVTNNTSFVSDKARTNLNAKFPKLKNVVAESLHELSLIPCRTTFKVSEFQETSEKRAPTLRDITNRRDIIGRAGSFKDLKPLPQLPLRSYIKASMQTMSCIEAVMLKTSPEYLNNEKIRKELSKLSKSITNDNNEQPIVGMKDIELNPLIRLSSSHYDGSGFRNEHFDLGMSPVSTTFSPPRSVTVNSNFKKLRRLENKAFYASNSFTEKALATSHGDSTDSSFADHTFHTDNRIPFRDIRGTFPKPRSMGRVNPMDISFCLNVSSNQSNKISFRPTSRKCMVSRQELKSSAKPSDVFGSSELFDEPSFYRH